MECLILFSEFCGYHFKLHCFYKVLYIIDHTPPGAQQGPLGGLLW